MSFGKKRVRTRKRVARVLAGAVGLLAGSVLVPSTALAVTVTCAFDGAATVERTSDTQLSTPCGTEAFASDLVLELTGGTGNDTLTFDLTGGDVTDGGDVEFVVDLGAGTADEVAVVASDDGDALAYGTNGINLNLSGSTDVYGPEPESGDWDKVASMNAEVFSAEGGTGNDNFNAGGGLLNGDAFPIGVTFSGGGGGDRLNGGAGGDTLNGDNGIDSLSGGLGSDTLNGGSGNDRFSEGSAPNGNDAFNGGTGGRDLVDYSERETSVSVTYNDLADDGATDANGDATADDAEADNVKKDVERVWATAENDTLDATAGTGKYHLDGRSGDDTLKGSPQADRLTGGDDDDHMTGAGGNDVFLQGLDPDGADVMDGGAGTDTVKYATRAGDLSVTLTTGSTPAVGATGNDGAVDADPAAGDQSEADNIVNVENAKAGRGDDKLTAANVTSRLTGGSGNDELVGGSAADRLLGGSGNDKMDGGAGTDYANGGIGDDKCKNVEKKYSCESNWT